MLAFWHVKRWSPYLKARKFLVQVDNQVMISKNFLKNNHQPKLARWLQEIQMYNFTIEYITSAQNFLADGLTRSTYLDDSGSVEPVREKTLEDISLLSLYDRVQTSPQVQDTEMQEHPVNAILSSAVTSKTIAGRQDEDEVLNYVKQRIRSNNKEKKKDKFMSREQWLYIKNLGQYELDDNDCLLRRWVETPSGIERLVICVPNEMQPSLIEEAHSEHCSGHWGVQKTLYKLREKFYFPQMRKQVSLHILQCGRCARINAEITRKPKSPIQPYAAKMVGEKL